MWSKTELTTNHKMKECINCRAILEDDELFCHECGTKQEVEETEILVENPTASEEKYCVHCGKAIEADSIFCPFCGKPQEVKKEEPQQELSEEEKDRVKQASNLGVAKEDSYHEKVEKNKSKTWLWILLMLLIVGGTGVWYYLSEELTQEEIAPQVEALDTDSIEVPDEYMDYEEIVPTGSLAFLEEFYKGKIDDEDYIIQHVTDNVLNKLKHDYEYGGCDDCLATWIFTAYPNGADLDLEKGPIFSPTEREDCFKTDFKYSGYNGEQKVYETRTLYLTVTEIDGTYLISDYEVENGTIIKEKEGLLSIEDALEIADEMVIQDNHYKGFRSPDNVKNILKKYGYKYAGKYCVDREFLFDVLYYKDCLLGKSTGDGCYLNVPQASGSGTPSFIGIDGELLYIAPFNKAAFDIFLNQAKELGATMKENDESTIKYNYLNYEITGFKRGVFDIKYCILISKKL